jgi:threonine-phosphate decarboxylase
MIDGHGDDIYRYDDLVKTNFSATVVPNADLPAIQELLAERLGTIAHYPEPQPRSLERLIATRLGISPEAVMLTAGATEAIYLIARLFHHSASVIPQPTYTEYADACRINKHIISYENSDDLAELPKDRIYWICNPNNPSGNVLMKGFVEYVVKRSPRYTFVVDQSLEAYSAESLLHPAEMQNLPNLLTIHSIGKTYGMPGLRLGYITSAPSTISLLRHQYRPWAVSAIDIEAGMLLLNNSQPAVTDITACLEESERLRTALRQIEGIRVFETKTNYMLCEITPQTSTRLKSYLVHEHGMLIRDCSNFEGLSDHFFRITAQQPDENDALVAAIQQFMSTSEK